jgi:hypothetical protein
MENTLIIITRSSLCLKMVPAILAICQAVSPSLAAVETAIPPETILRALPALPSASEGSGEGDSDGKGPGKAAVAGVSAGHGDYVHWNSWAHAGATENEISYGMELLAPLWHDERSVLFLYPQVGALDAGRQSYSLGAGGRVQLDSAPIILGANVFYDHSEGFYNQNFDQLGAGVEVLSDWWEFRANGYLNLSDQRLIDSVRTTETSSRTRQTGSSSQYVSSDPQYATGHSIVQQNYYRQTQTFQTVTTNTTRVWENFAQPMSGLDAEFGVLVPGLPKRNIEARLFVGGYYYRNPFGGKDLTGMKARAEVRLWDRLYLDGAWAQDEEVMGGNWYAGIRVNIPFGAKAESSVRLSNGLHPLTTRLNEAVRRNARPVVAKSGYLENVDLREVLRAIQVRRAIRVVAKTQVIQDKIDFVDNTATQGGQIEDRDKPTVVGNGTAENPYQSIVLAAADAAQRYGTTGMAHTVMVRPTAWAYQGNVLITAPMHITGAQNCGGILHSGLADVATGGNPNYAVGFTDSLALVFGGFEAHNVAGRVEIDGFIIRNGSWSGDGIVLTNVAQSSIHCNNISVPGNGINVRTNWNTNSTEIYNNILNGNGGNGIKITGEVSGHLSGRIAGNDVSSNGGHGLDIRLDGASWPIDTNSFNSSWSGNVVNNRFSNNIGNGFRYEGAGNITGNLLDNYFNENQGAAGVEFTNTGKGVVGMSVAFNDIRNNLNGGVYVSGEHGSETILPVISNNIYANGSFGYRANLKDDATLRGDVQDNYLAINHRSGVEFSLGNNSRMDVSLLHNDAHGSGTDGFVGYLDGGNFTGNISNNNLDGNGRNGLFIYSTPGAYNSVVTGQINNNEMNHNGSNGLAVEMNAGNFGSGVTANTANNNGNNGLSFSVNHTTLNLDVHHNIANQNGDSGISVLAHGGTQVWGTGIQQNTLIGNNGTAHLPFAGLDVTVANANWNAGDISLNEISGSAFRGLSLNLTGNSTWNGDVAGNNAHHNAFAPYGAGTLSGSGIFLGIANSGITTLNLTNNLANHNGSGLVINPVDAGIDILSDAHPGTWNGNITGNTANDNRGLGLTWRTSATGDATFNGDFQNNSANDNLFSGFLIISGPAPVTIGGGTQTGGNTSSGNINPDYFIGGFGL